MQAQTRREHEMKGLEKVCGPRPAEKGDKEGRRGLRAQTRGQQIWGQGPAGPDPQKKLRRWVMVSAGQDPKTAEVKEVEAACRPSPAERTR